MNPGFCLDEQADMQTIKEGSVRMTLGCRVASCCGLTLSPLHPTLLLPPLPPLSELPSIST